jgi:hypothetical protein
MRAGLGVLSALALLCGCKTSHDAVPDAGIPSPLAVDPTEAAHARRVESVKAWTPAQRMAWVKHCLPAACANDEVADVAAAGGSVDEIAALGHVGYARLIAMDAATGHDGDEVSATAVNGILDVYRHDPDAETSALPHTTRANAMKDIVSERGKFLTVTGNIVKIQRDGDVFWSILTDDSGNPCYLFTALDADGVDEDKRATFEGVAVQRWKGETAQFLLAVGRFSGKRHVLAPAPK